MTPIPDFIATSQMTPPATSARSALSPHSSLRERLHSRNQFLEFLRQNAKRNGNNFSRDEL